MTGTIHQLAAQAKHDEMLGQAAEARRAGAPRVKRTPRLARVQARTALVTLLTIIAMCVAAGAASAETVHVDLAQQDSVADDGACSLREAINLTNGGPPSSYRGCSTTPEPTGSNVISLEATSANGAVRYPIGSIGADHANATGDFDIVADVAIVGAGPARSWIDGAHLDRVLQVADGTTVSVTGVTILNGQARNGPAVYEGGAGYGDDGGAISNLGTLTLTDCVVRDNAAGRGANAAPGKRGGYGGAGGGIWSSGPLTLVNTIVTHNRTGDGGKGGDGGDVPDADGGDGGVAGGVAAFGGLVIRESRITDNTAGAGGAGGVASVGTAGDGAAGGAAGGLFAANGASTISNSIVAGNRAGNGGAGGEVTLGSAGTGGAGGAGGGVVMALEDIRTGNIESSSIAGNAAGEGGVGGHSGDGVQPGQGAEGGSGGGLFVFSGAISVTGSTIADNASGSGGEGAEGAHSAQGGEGGAVATIGGELRIATSTLSGNRAGAGAASSAEPMARGGRGGAVYVAGVGLEMVNSTVSGNAAGRGGASTSPGFEAGRGGAGGGIYAAYGDVSVTSSTIASNTVGGGGAGTQPGVAGAGGAIIGGATVGNSLLVSNGASGCFGAITDGGHNVDFPASGCPGSNADPRLGALAGNGGATQTHALGAGSAARDQVPASGAGCPSTDQRGVSRPNGGACDIGAFEAEPVPVSSGGTTPSGGAARTDVADTMAPVVTRYALASKKLRRGTRISYAVSEAGTAMFTVKKCAKRCKPVGSFSRRSVEGVNGFTFKGTNLKPGRYKLVLVTRDAAGNASKPKAIAFKVVR